MKKILILFVAVGVFALTGCGSKISKEEALKVALDDAGVKQEDITITKESISDDSYEFEFYTKDASYQYEIEDNGKIEEHEIKHLNNQTNHKQNNTGNEVNDETVISQEEALAKAYAHFQIEAANATLVEVKQDVEDHAKVYDIEFVSGNKEYSIEINMHTGEVVSYDVDTK